MKSYAWTLGILICSTSYLPLANAATKENKKNATKTEIRVIGPAADDLFSIVNLKPAKNISCTEVIVPACPNCDGGSAVKVCTLKAQQYSADL